MIVCPQMPHTLTCKPRKKTTPYKLAHKPQEKPKKNAPKSSAKHTDKKACKNLTFHDWLTVLQFADEVLNWPQSGSVQVQPNTKPEPDNIWTLGSGPV